jgi:sec-independent protein translocase protein TatC
MAKAAAQRQDDDDNEPAATELESGRMPFLSHLSELRDRVRNAAIVFMIAAGVCYYYCGEIFNWLQVPLSRVWDVKKLGPFHLVYGSLTEPFWVNMSIALWAGIFVASPFIFYQLWKFIAPGLYKKERRITVAFSLFSAVFFTAGAAFCYYFVLDGLYGFLISFADKDLTPQLLMKEYLDLTRDMMLAFGAVFELPLLIYFLAMIGLVTHRSLWKFNRWFVIIAFIVGAILTPSPDVVSQLLMAAPMILLYNISIIFAWNITRKRERAEAEQRAKDEA